MPLRPPTESELRELGNQLHLDPTDAEVPDYRELVADILASYETVRDQGQPQTGRADPRPRNPGYRVRENDKYNAWITRCGVPGAGKGPLSGWDIGIKDISLSLVLK